MLTTRTGFASVLSLGLSVRLVAETPRAASMLSALTTLIVVEASLGQAAGSRQGRFSGV